MYKFFTKDIRLPIDDSHARHKEIQRHFPYGKNTRYRFDGSGVTVCCDGYPSTSISCKMSVIKKYNNGDQLSFKIRACASIKDKGGSGIPIMGLTHQISWFEKQAKRHGFSVLSWEKIDPLGPMFGYKNGMKRTHNPVEFEGRLQVTDETPFNQTLGSLDGPDGIGIGPAKYSGLGLLIVED